MEHKEAVLGVIGGLGPLSTAHFMELVAKMTDAQTDQEHLGMIVYNFPSIPDRTEYILGYYRKNPFHGLLYAGKALEAQKAGCIAIPCITAHYFHRELSENLDVPIINAVAETIRYLQANGIRKVGIMATEGTVSSGLFSRETESAGIEWICPSPAFQADVTHIIYQNIKKGLPPDMARFRRVEEELRRQGAEVILLGCTELSLIKRDYSLGAGFLDAMEVLARQTVLRCGKPLKPEYESLISL